MTALARGFGNAVLESQTSFRSIIRALSAPGELQTLSVDTPWIDALTPATVAVMLTLLDHDTPLWLDDTAGTEAVRDYVRFHCGAPIVDDPAAAAFGVYANSRALAVERFPVGDDRYPDRSATLIVQVDALDIGEEATLRGPGINGERTLTVPGLPDDFAEQWQLNASLYPLGVDLFLTAGLTIAGLPRTSTWHAARG